MTKLDKIKEWLLRSLACQEGIKFEHIDIPFPQWNQGYLECLEDLQKIVLEDE